MPPAPVSLLLGFCCLLLMPARAKLDIARQSVHSVVLDKQALAAALANAQPTLWSADAGLLPLKARLLVASVDLSRPRVRRSLCHRPV